MAMLAATVELVIGVDTHKHTHTAAVVAAATGAVVEQVTVPATPAGYRQLLRLADRQDSRRVWAIESTGGYGAGLTRFLQAHAPGCGSSHGFQRSPLAIGKRLNAYWRVTLPPVMVGPRRRRAGSG
jgi:Transposase